MSDPMPLMWQPLFAWLCDAGLIDDPNMTARITIDCQAGEAATCTIVRYIDEDAIALAPDGFRFLTSMKDRAAIVGGVDRQVEP